MSACPLSLGWDDREQALAISTIREARPETPPAPELSLATISYARFKAVARVLL
jgi:hypothetical protein